MLVMKEAVLKTAAELSGKTLINKEILTLTGIPESTEPAGRGLNFKN